MKRERGSPDVSSPSAPIDADDSTMRPWLPPNILEQFIPFYLEQPRDYPQLYNADCNMEMLHLWMLYGRAGNDKGATLATELERRGIPTVLETVTHKKEEESIDCVGHLVRVMAEDVTPKVRMDRWQHTVEKWPQVKDATFLVVIVEHAELLHRAATQEPKIHERILALPEKLLGTQVVVIFSYGIPPNGLPPDVKSLFKAELYWPYPDDAWRKDFFIRQFERYKAMVTPVDDLRVLVEMEDEDYDFLVNSSHFHTIEELNNFCNIVFNAVHRVGEVHHCDRRFMGQQEQAAHDTCTRDVDGVLYRVLNVGRIREHHLKDVGGEYSISAGNTKQIEDMFHAASRRGYLAEPDNTNKVILYEDPAAQAEKEIQEKIKVNTQDGTQHFMFDPETGKEVPVDATNVGAAGLVKSTGANGAGAPEPQEKANVASGANGAAPEPQAKKQKTSEIKEEQEEDTGVY